MASARRRAGRAATVARPGAASRTSLFSGRTAAEAVAHNKLRAGLTSLGILFGVASVIAMLAIGNGAEQEILEQMKMLGANNIVITPIVEQKEGKVDTDPTAKKTVEAVHAGALVPRRRSDPTGRFPTWARRAAKSWSTA